MSKRSEGTGTPLICNPFPMSRVDCTPKSERIMISKFSVDTSGNPIPEPDKNYAQLALESDPNLMFEHFDEYWRKIHGAKICHEDSPDDRSAESIAVYAQIHRTAGGPSSSFPPPYKAPQDAEGRLPTNPAAEVPPYKRPKWDGVIHMCNTGFEMRAGFSKSDKYKNKIAPDEGIFVRAGLRAMTAEYILIPRSYDTPDSIVVVKLYYKQNGTREDFQKRLLWDHADYICSLPETEKYVTRYGLLINIEPPIENPSPEMVEFQKIEAVSMMSFRNMTDCERYIGGPDYQKIDKLESEFVDQSQSEWWTGIYYGVIDRIGKEVATNRNIKVEYVAI